MVTELTELVADNPTMSGLSGYDAEDGSRAKRKVDIGLVYPDPDQPRTEFDDEDMRTITLSIATVGQLVPMQVRVHPMIPGAYMIIQGERRWRACKALGIQFLKIDVISGDPAKLRQHAAVDNLVRAPLSHLDISRSILSVLQTTDEGEERITRAKVAQYFGQSTAWVDQHLSLLRLPARIHELMGPPVPKKKRLPYSIALLLLTIPNDGEKIDLAFQFFRDGIRYNRAKRIIEKRTHKLKVVGVKKLAPRKEYKKLDIFISRLSDESDLIMEMLHNSVAAMLGNKSKAECQRLLNHLKQSLTNLQSIKVLLELEANKKR